MIRRTEPTDDVRADAGAGREAAAAHSSEAKAPRQTPAAAGVAQSAPQPAATASAFDLLQKALADIERRGSIAAAAGVSARMRQLDPGFAPTLYGFRTFRALLDAAQAEGRVHLYERDGVTDVLLSSSPVGSSAPQARQRMWLRQDLWRAVLDYHSGAAYAYDRSTHATTAITEPEAIAEPCVVVPLVNADEMRAWMTAFAGEQSEPARGALLGALSTDDPLRAFEDEVARDRWLERRWKRAMRAQVAQRVAGWATEKGVPMAHLEAETQPAPTASRSPSRATTQEDALPDDGELRDRILRAVSAMPLSELLKLAIPVEYVLRR